MRELEKIRHALYGLVVFRGLRRDPVIARFEAMLGAIGTAEKVNAYAAFAAALFAKNVNWTQYLLDKVLYDENIYVAATAGGNAPDDVILQCTENELEVLQTASRLTAKDIKGTIEYSGFLPEWHTSDVNFAAAHAAHIGSIGKRGYGMFSRYHMFAVENGDIVPLRFTDPIRLSDLKGYENERQAVLDNTMALLGGKAAADVLLYGDAGTGKSSTIKAIVNALRDDGLRLIEVKKSQFLRIPHIVEKLSANPLKFILYIDDLSFVQENDEYNALKAMLQGSAFAKTRNIAIYATSNRRHVIKETFSDRSDDDIHRNETIQEQISLSQRFGLTVGFFKPNKKQYLTIVHALKDEYGIVMDDDVLDIEAERYASMGRTPRAARQLMEYLKRKQG